MQINVHDLAHAKGVPVAAREAMLLMQERIAELEAENAQLKAMQVDDGELLTIAYMDGSHRSTKAHRAKIAELEAEVARLRKQCGPEWFYLAGDMSSDRCRVSPHEVIDEDWLYDNRGEGSAVVQIECATPCPDIWAAVRFFTNEEKDERASDDDYELTEHATEEEARAALKGQPHD